MGPTGSGTVLREFVSDHTFLIRNAVSQGCSIVKLSRYIQGAGSHLHHCKEGEKGGLGECFLGYRTAQIQEWK